MPRKPRRQTNDCYYHVFNRTNNKDWFNCEMADVWKMAQASLRYAYQSYPLELYQFVLMPNHYHMLVRTPNSDLAKFMHLFSSRFSQLLRLQTNRINRMFGGRYKASVILDQRGLWQVYRYIYQNPLKANLSARCEFYPYSTLFCEERSEHFCIPIANLAKELSLSRLQFLEWLNLQIDSKESSAIKKGIFKSIYKPVYARNY